LNFTNVDPTGVASSHLGFIAALATGKPLYVPPGNYYFSSTIPCPVKVDIEGAGPESTRFFGLKNLILFSNGVQFVETFRVEGIEFDGQRVRTNFPYMAWEQTDTYGIQHHIVLLANRRNNRSRFYVRNCRFKDTVNLPLVADHFHNCRVYDCEFYRTRDPGFRFCDTVQWIGNTSRFGSDNGVSISRGCRHVTVNNNLFHDMESYGLWLSGFNVPMTGTITISGAAYTPGSLVNVSTSAGGLGSPSLDVLYSIPNGDGTWGTIKIASVTNSTTATAYVLQEIKVAAQAVATSGYYQAPHNGVATFTCMGNTIIGGYSSGLGLREAVRRGTITGNTFIRNGFIADSEKFTRGTIPVGSSTLTVTNGAIFTLNQFALIEPPNSFQDYFLAKVTGIAGNVLTLNHTAPETYADEEVRPVQESPGEGYHILLTAQPIGIYAQPEYMNISGNLFDESKQVSIQLGNTGAGPARRVSVTNNQFFRSQGASSTNGIAVAISENATTQVSDIVVAGNQIGSGHIRSVSLAQYGTAPRTVTVRDNVGFSGTGLVITDNSNAGAQVTVTGVGFSSIDKSGAEFFENIGFTNSTTPVVTTNVMPVNRFANVLSTAETINSFTLGAAFGTTISPLFILRNGSGVTSITITYNQNFIRTQSGANLILGPYQAALFCFISSTVVQQIG
jgi:hypothetical protein